MNLLIISQDIDGSVVNPKFMRAKKSPERTVQANAAYIKSQSQNIRDEGFDQVYFISGSRRQDMESDFFNSTSLGIDSSFLILQQLSDGFQKELAPIPCQLNMCLLADLYGNKPQGENFKHGLKKNMFYTYSKWVDDPSKLTITYAQMHMFATEHKNDSIVYELVDDQEEEILQPLLKFYADNRDLIPSNVTLRFSKYDGGEKKVCGELKGTGLIDENYQENLKLMMKCVGKQPGSDSYYKGYHILHSLIVQNNKELIAFKNQRSCVKTEEKSELIISSTQPQVEEQALSALHVGTSSSPDMSMEESEQLPDVQSSSSTVSSSRTHGLFASSQRSTSATGSSSTKASASQNSENKTGAVSKRRVATKEKRQAFMSSSAMQQDSSLSGFLNSREASNDQEKKQEGGNCLLM